MRTKNENEQTHINQHHPPPSSPARGTGIVDFVSRKFVEAEIPDQP